MKKKLLALILALALSVSLTACGGDTVKDDTSGDSAQTEDQTPAGDETSGGDETPADGPIYKVGISQYVTHDALDAATKGFQDALNELLPGQVEFDYQNAAEDTATCATIANGFVADGVDLIMANATPALQAAAAATGDIPILGTSVTEYGVAFNIENFSGTVGGNVSGTSDLAPLDQQAQMIHEWYPDAKTVGLIYCSAEPNSQYQVDNVQSYLEGMGYACTQFPFSDTNDMASVVQNAADNSDVLYVPTDNTAANNTAANNTEAIANVVIPAGVPVVAGEEGICSGCGVVTLSISYYDIGVIAGEMAYDILVNGADVSTMPVKFAPEVTKKYNAANCQALNITVPGDYEAIG